MSRDLYPADSVGPGRSFERVKFPDVPSGEYNLEIFVAEVCRRRPNGAQTVTSPLHNVHIGPHGLTVLLTPHELTVLGSFGLLQFTRETCVACGKRVA